MVIWLDFGCLLSKLGYSLSQVYVLTLCNCCCCSRITTWDVEKERLVLLTEKSLLIIKYDFINLRLVEYKRLSLALFDRVAIGELKYPDGSFIP